MKYFLIDGDAPAHKPSAEWNALSKQTLHCVCGNRFPTVTAVEVTLAKPPVKVPLTAVGFSSVGVIRDDLRKAIGESLFEETFHTAAVSVAGSVAPGFRSFVGRSPLRLRGNATSWFRFCSRCESMWYLAFEPYVLSVDVREGKPLYATNRCPIVARDDVADKINRGRVKRVVIRPLESLEAPIDGLPVDLRDAPRDKQRGTFT